MTDERLPDVTPEPVPERIVERRSPWRRVIRWSAIALTAVAALIGAGLLLLDTEIGHAFIARQINATRLQSGVNFRVNRIDGSIYGTMILRDFEVRDTKGPFASAKQVTVDWRPFSYFANRIDIRALSSPEVHVARRPALEPVPADPNAPILPSINIDVAKIDFARIDIAQPVTGRRHLGRLAGSLHISDGRAQIDARGLTLTGPGIAGGDQLALKLDAVPDKDMLDIDLRLNAPANGLVTGLVGLEAPLTFTIDGDGSWKHWAGRAVSTLGGSEFANLAVKAESGTFHVRGATHPGLYMKGPVERLASPQLDVSLDAAWSDRKADTKLTLRSSALQVDCTGLLDLGNSRFGDFRVQAALLTPGAIAPNLRGNSVRLDALFNGPFIHPVVDYKLQAAALGFGTTTVEGLYAEGKARVDANRILIPIKARAKHVAGLSAAAGGLVDNLTLEGDLAVTGDQILSDNLHLKSNRIDATAIVVADLSTGRYTGALKGRVNDYEIDGIAMVDLTTDAKLVAQPGGGWGIQGEVAARSTKIISQGVRTFLGGDATASARVKIDAKGVVSFGGLKLQAPEFRLSDGSGLVNPDGSILINANGISQRYGPMTARVTGTFAAPDVALRAPHPGMGVGLADLEAQIKGRNGIYAVVAKGQTDYGPFSANVLVGTGATTTYDISAGRFAGMDVKGRLQGGQAGLLAGRLDFAGSGVNGHVQLSAQGNIQRADVDARAANAKIPGAAELTIGQAIVTGTILFADTPQVVGDAQVANLRSGNFVLKTARAKIDYRGGSGTAQFLASGSTGVPFTIAANAKLSPREWLVAVQGQGSGVRFHTEAPAHIAVQGSNYRLQPTRIAFDQGSALVAGRYGDGMTLQTRLEKVDLAVVNAFVPGLGIGGTATGAFDFTQATATTFPRADARIEISGFTRSSIAAVSSPVDLSFVGRLLPNGGDARALIRRGGSTIGRMVATLSPLGPEAGSWRERLLAAPLSGGIRYNGPAAVIFSLAGLPDQTLNGPLGLAADFGGRVRTPQLTGVVKANNLVYENETYGTRLSNLKIDGRFSNDQLIVNQLTATAGSGTVSAQGSFGFSAEQGYPMKLTADLNNARLARSDALGATATGKLTITSDADGGRIEGRLSIPEARYEVIRQGAAEVSELTGVRRKGEALLTPQQRATAAARKTWALNLRLRAENELFISGMGLESEWAATMMVRGTSAHPEVTGSATVIRGTYDFAGKRFDITRGTIRFVGGEMSNPTVDISATANAEGVTAILNVSGTAQRPRISFTSTPALAQEEVLARILFGSSVTNLNATEAIQLAASLNALRGGGGGLNPLGKLRSATGIDRLQIVSADAATGRGTALSAGKYITNDIYVEIITDARGYTATQLEIALSKALSVLSQTGSFGGSGVSLKYSKDY
jgi:translocation and assembly module TamB